MSEAEWSPGCAGARGVVAASCAAVSAAHERRLRNLFFEDFCEALVHVSRMKALPTDEQIADAGATDAADFFDALRATLERGRACWVLCCWVLRRVGT